MDEAAPDPDTEDVKSAIGGRDSVSEFGDKPAVDQQSPITSPDFNMDALFEPAEPVADPSTTAMEVDAAPSGSSGSADRGDVTEPVTKAA